ncbi:MAG: hypothetical protein IKN78_02060 [Bacteroidales bacterium]|nr:hypothetical protein [Bacteroidales bacterium]
MNIQGYLKHRLAPLMGHPQENPPVPKNFLLLIQKKEKIRTFATVFEPW